MPTNSISKEERKRSKAEAKCICPFTEETGEEIGHLISCPKAKGYKTWWQEKEKEIKYPATCTVHWVTGPVDCCEKHAKQIVALGRVMGTHVAITTLEKKAECSNCKNESLLKS